MFTANNLVESKLIIYKGSFGYVNNYLQAFFYLKLIFGGIEVYYTFIEAYSKIGRYETDLPENIKEKKIM